MPKFKTYDDVERYLKNTIAKTLFRSKEMESIIANAMYDAVLKVVYEPFEPVKYERRENLEGLSDIANMIFTDFGVNAAGDVYVVLENLTEGADNMKGQFITDTIVEGIQANWGNPEGEWSMPRDFVGEAAKRLRTDITPLVTAFKKALEARGFVVK